MAIHPPIRIASTSTAGGLTLSIIYGLENICRAILGTLIAITGLEILETAKLMSIALFVASIFSLPIVLFAGSLIVSFSRKSIFTLACLLVILGTLLLTIESTSAYIIGNTLRMSGSGLSMICIALYTMDFIPNKELAQVESRKILFAAMGWMIFPGIGTWLWSNTNHEIPFYFSSSVMFILLLLFWWLRLSEAKQINPPNKKHLNLFSNLKSYFFNPHMRVAYLVAVTRSSAWVVFFTFGPIYFIDAGIPVQWVGFIMGSIISVFIFSSYFALFAEKIGVRQTIYYSFLISGICLSIMGILPKPTIWGITFLFIATLGMEMLDIIGNLPFMRMVSPKIRTEMTTVYSTWREFSLTLTPGISALFLFFIKVHTLFLVMGVTLLFAGYLSKKMPKRVD